MGVAVADALGVRVVGPGVVGVRVADPDITSVGVGVGDVGVADGVGVPDAVTGATPSVLSGEGEPVVRHRLSPGDLLLPQALLRVIGDQRDGLLGVVCLTLPSEPGAHAAEARTIVFRRAGALHFRLRIEEIALGSPVIPQPEIRPGIDDIEGVASLREVAGHLTPIGNILATYQPSPCSCP